MGRDKKKTVLSTGVSSATEDAASEAAQQQQQQHNVMIRSLRRRFWQALQNEDVEAALALYQATKHDYEMWQRQAEQERRKQEELSLRQKHQQRPALLKLIKNKTSKRRGASSTGQQQQQQQQSSSARRHPRHQRKDNDSAFSVGLLQLYMSPSDPFQLDDYRPPDAPYDNEDDTEDSNPATSPRFRPLSRQRRSSCPTSSMDRTVRRRGSRWQENSRSLILFGGGGRQRQSSGGASEEGEPAELDPDLDPRMTTPLHEAARLGHGPLVRLLLEQEQADPNARNGVGRTALHMVAGGLTSDEAGWLLTNTAAAAQSNENDEQPQPTAIETTAVGIREPLPMVPESDGSDDHVHPATVRAKNAAKVVGRFFRDTFAHNTNSKDKTAVSNSNLNPACSSETQASSWSEEQWQERVQDRMDAALSILSWSHVDDGSDRAGEGPSTNAVDSRGRTALHYAAELGRADICGLLITTFGTMLTIIDDHARTPCELAAEQKHADLAAHLEASALLYLDPYGVDDELLTAALSGGGAGSSGDYKSLAPPFSWFETWTLDKVQEERCRRVDVTFRKMQKIVQMVQDDENARSLMFDDIMDDPDSKLDSAKDGDSESQSLNESEHGSPPPAASFSASAKEDSLQSSIQSSEGSRHLSDGTIRTLQAFEYLSKPHVELFLASHGWEVKKALKAFFRHRAEAFGEANVPLPIVPPSTNVGKSDDGAQVLKRTCLICCEELDQESPKWRTLSSCQHSFCADCLGDYIADCAKSKSSGLVVVCPHHECQVPLDPLEVINLSPTSEVYGSLIDTANENFVVSASDFRFCPHPSCLGVVKFNCPPYVKTAGLDPDMLVLVGSVCTAVHEKTDACLPTYEGVTDPCYFDSHSSVQPKHAHRFCFQCGELGFHWPVTCERLEEWKNTVQETVQDVDDDGVDANESKDFNDVAQKLWMKANTRPCPKCKAPIEKNEGCNHMTCTNPHCRHEFCWICRNDWKLHNTETGGFFRCNRWEEQKEHQFYDDPPPTESDSTPSTGRHRTENITDPSRMDITYGTAMHEARVAGKRSKDMARFLHHYRRFNAHKESSELEHNMSQTVCRRLAPVVEAAVLIDGSRGFNFGGKGLSFVHAAFTELLECRSMLQHSYAFSFFRYKSVHPTRYRLYKRRLKEKLVFEQLQSELELMTEQMSDVAARSHLRATQAQITFLTVEAANKRKEMSNFMINLLSEEHKEDSSGLEGSSHSLRGSSAHSRLSLRGSSAHSRLGDSSGRSHRSSSGHSRRVGGDGGLRVSGLDDRIIGTATPESGADSRSQSRRSSRSQSSGHDDEESEGIEEALRASLEEFMSNTGARDAVDVDDDESERQQSDWPCTACTYMNSGGSRCAMCETPR